MPIYDYVCGACGRVTEVIHGIHDPGPRLCPECGTEGSMRKALSSPAILFKGSGWAKVDRRASHPAPGPGATASKAQAGEKAGSAEGDAAKAPAETGAAAATAAPADAPSGAGSDRRHRRPASDGGGD